MQWAENTARVHRNVTIPGGRGTWRLAPPERMRGQHPRRRARPTTHSYLIVPDHAPVPALSPPDRICSLASAPNAGASFQEAQTIHEDQGFREFRRFAAVSRRCSEPVPVQTARDGKPLALTWRSVTYRVTYRVRVSGRWWEPERHADRTYETADHQIFALSRGAAQDGR